MPIIDKSTSEVIRIDVSQVSIYGQDAVKFKALLSEKLGKQAADVHFNFGQVKYIDSATIGTLLYFIQVLKKKQKKIVIEKITPELRELLETLMLEKYMQMPEA